MTNCKAGAKGTSASDSICHWSSLIALSASAIGYWLFAKRCYLLFEAVIGSRPLAVMAWVAAGEDRKVIKDLAASGSLDPVTIPAEKMVIFWTSLGKGPTNSIPEIGFNSLICWKPISASPRAITDPTGSAGIIRLLAVT
jgi:hypothetical protein